MEVISLRVRRAAAVGVGLALLFATTTALAVDPGTVLGDAHARRRSD